MPGDHLSVHRNLYNILLLSFLALILLMGVAGEPSVKAVQPQLNGPYAFSSGAKAEQPRPNSLYTFGSTAADTNGNLFNPYNINSLYSLNLRDGSPQARFVFPQGQLGVEFGFNELLTTGDGVIYLGSMSSKNIAMANSAKPTLLSAIEARTGKLLWQQDLQDAGIESISCQYKTIYVHTDNGQLIALDPQTGASNWQFSPAGSVVFAGEAVYVDTAVDVLAKAGTRLLKLDPYSGEILWQSKLSQQGFVLNSFTAIHDMLYYSLSAQSFGHDEGGRVIALDLNAQRIRWSRAYEANDDPAVTTDGQSLYLFGSQGTLTSLNPANGQLYWQRNKVNADYRASADGILYLTANGSEETLLALDAASGKTLWSQGTVSGANLSISPAITPGVVYIDEYYPSTSMDLAYALQDKTATELWCVRIEDSWQRCTKPSFMPFIGMWHGENGDASIQATLAVSPDGRARIILMTANGKEAVNLVLHHVVGATAYGDVTNDSYYFYLNDGVSMKLLTIDSGPPLLTLDLQAQLSFVNGPFFFVRSP